MASTGPPPRCSWACWPWSRACRQGQARWPDGRWSAALPATAGWTALGDGRGDGRSVDLPAGAPWYPPHGAAFQLWARAFERAVPGMSIKTCHTYDVFGGKFRYRCTGCGNEFARHSKSVDVERKCCAACGGRLTFVGTFERDGTPSKPRTANAYAQFVKLHYAALKQAMPGASQADVMAALGQRWRPRPNNTSEKPLKIMIPKPARRAGDAT
jgi:DNA-directed RNA polymerase subunit RPC12/RpoP